MWRDAGWRAFLAGGRVRVGLARLVLTGAGLGPQDGVTLWLMEDRMPHPNEDLVKEAFAAFGRGDIEVLRRQYFAEDIRWHFPGRSALAGDHEGVDRVVQMLGRPAELSGGTHRIELHDVIGNDDHVVAL